MKKLSTNYTNSTKKQFVLIREISGQKTFLNNDYR
jgi:hypothetical protein